MTEARDKLAARRAAYRWIANAIDACPPVSLLGMERSEAVEIQRIRDAIHAASLVEDADISALEDGDPVPGKCQDKACPGPHLLPVRAENCPHCLGAVRENGVRLTGGGLAHTKCYEEWAIKTADELTRAGERRPLLPERRKKR